MNEHSRNVRPPTSITMTAGTGLTRKQGASFTSRNTPAFTMVEECRSALVGVGATIAPSSHVWNGICAAFVMPANASSTTGTMPSVGSCTVMLTKSLRESVPISDAQNSIARMNAMPPARFMTICLKALRTASSVFV